MGQRSYDRALRSHARAVISVQRLVCGRCLTPDFARDMHAMKGKEIGRGLDRFRKEGARLIPPPTEPDPFENEAYRLWEIRQQGR